MEELHKMNDIEQLKEYRKKISELSEEEKKQRDLHLKKLSNGEIYGPQTGFASIDKQWLKYYKDSDIMQDVPKMKAYDYLLLNNSNNLSKNAINYLGIKITFKELFDKIDETAKALVNIGVSKGDIVTLAMANTPEMVYLLYALNRIGAICNVIDPRLSSEEMKREINTVNSKTLITLDLCYPTTRKIINETNIENTICLSAVESMPLPVRKIAQLKNKKVEIDEKTISWHKFLHGGKNINYEISSEYEANSPIVLVHTGGTTGTPKGVILTNENFVTMANMHKFGGLDYTQDDKFLNILPPFIAYCLCNGINMPLTLGLEVTLVPKFEPKEFPQLLEKYKPNHVLSGPILWEYVIQSNIKDLSYLKTPVSGGDVLTPEIEKRINEFFKKCNCNVKVAQGYGLTEISSAAVFSTPEANKLGSVGIPFIKNVVSVFDPDTMLEKHCDEEGEVWISTDTAMLGYYNNQAATDDMKITTPDGRSWIKTGDIGKISSDGNIYIIGRMKRMIVRNGNKIFPANVENIVLQLPEIKNCAIIGIDDIDERKVPAINIVLSDDCNDAYDDVCKKIVDIINKNLPEFNIPKKFIFRDELPLTGINKINFKELESEKLEEGNIIVLSSRKRIK